MICPLLIILLNAIASSTANSQASLPSTYPHRYSGIPAGPFSTEWQDYFEVRDALPNVTWTLPRSFAGNINVNRTGHPNNTLFFWGFEKEYGSFTAAAGERDHAPWAIWLNGGPGSSSMLGLTLENGPIRIASDYSAKINNDSWNRLVDTVWVDQPVGTGFSTSDSTGYIADEDQMAQDFLGFLQNLVAVFPSFANRPLYLIGESYAGVYCPYIAKALFSTCDPPVTLRKIALGNAAMGSVASTEDLATVTIIETYPELINFDPEVYDYFKEQEHICGYDLNFTYPQDGLLPDLFDPAKTASKEAVQSFIAARRARVGRSVQASITQAHAARTDRRELAEGEREDKQLQWKRAALRERANGTLDPWYGCFLLTELIDYAVNFTFPWSGGGFNVYNIPDALNPEVPIDPSIFLNDERTRAAIHAPLSAWEASVEYPFNNTNELSPGSNAFGDPSIQPAVFFSELAANASEHNVTIILYSGNDDSLVSHRGSEVLIQNTTFGGTQGFMFKPSTPWFDDNGNLAGTVHQERGLTYVLVLGAGHQVPLFAPQSALVLLREFILGSNDTGLVVVTPDGRMVTGGVDPALAGDFVPGSNDIFYGSGSTAFSTSAPSATFAAWSSFLASATATTGG